jgi:D-alanyl-D-alanine carboxypeptidase
MPRVTSPAIQRAIVAAVEKDRRIYGGRTPVPGVLIGVWDGAGGSFVRTFGYANLTKRVPLSAADHFRIGSNTKTFVVAVILQLVDEHKLSLDDPISKFNVGVKVPNARNITIRQLCNMRSGLFEAFDSPEFQRAANSGKWASDRTIVTWAVRQKPYFPPGRGYHYTNTGFLILGSIIQSITHDTVSGQIRKRFLVPYNLTQTSFPETQAMPDPWARGYGLDSKRNWEDVSGTVPVSVMGAAGAMISDMSDMKRWIKLYVTGKTSSPAMHRALMDCLPTGGGFGAGFGLALGCSAGWYGYTGGLPGYNTSNFYFPKTGATIVAWVDVQANKPAPGGSNAMFRDIARILTPGNDPLPSGTKGL